MTESTPTPGKKSFVFQDPHGKRWPRLRGILVLCGVIMGLAIIWFFPTLFIHPELRLPASVRSLKGQIRAAIRKSAADFLAGRIRPIEELFAERAASAAKRKR